ncbi:MAG: hypothetical protein DCC67_16710 [Planctomycetota bacterium]|nr:MAG: hypothetical protein DCC67_16710 [Planctomycetota bacterium]
MNAVPASRRREIAARRRQARRALAAAAGALAYWSAAAVAGYTLTAPAGALGRPEHLSGWPGFSHASASVPSRPHPAVVRIVVPEGEVTSYGSGTLVDVRDQYGLVVTNWHVVRDSRGEVDVVFPDGFASKARPLKVDADWDLAALIVWRPAAEPVKIAAAAPQPGDRLTICGYGSGQYREATGRCTQYYAPALDLPQHMVELDVEARQGDSGGPIFNERGELAGVLFGAGHGTTMGSFGGRVGAFLASLAPDIGSGAASRVARDHAPPTPPAGSLGAPIALRATATIEPAATAVEASASAPHATDEGIAKPPSAPPSSEPSPRHVALQGDWHAGTAPITHAVPMAPAIRPAAPAPQAAGDWFDSLRNALAVVGAVAVALQLARIVR